MVPVSLARSNLLCISSRVMMITLVAELLLLSIIIVENNWNFNTPVEFQRYKYAADDISVIFSTFDIFTMLTIILFDCVFRKKC